MIHDDMLAAGDVHVADINEAPHVPLPTQFDVEAGDALAIAVAPDGSEVAYRVE